MVGAFGNLVASISAHRSASSLTSLELDDPYEAINMHEGSAYEIPLSLFSFGALQLVALRIPTVCAQPNDSWLEGAAITWPLLRVLSLANVPSPLTTLTGLLPLVKHCPALRTLCLSLDVKQALPTLLRGHGVYNEELESLSLCSTPISSINKVFHFLTSIFPYSRGVVGYSLIKGEDGRRDKVKFLPRTIASKDDVG
jgi:hypothetical protein